MMGSITYRVQELGLVQDPNESRGFAGADL